MSENYPSPISSLFGTFVRQPDDVIGMVAFALYQADEIDFIEQYLTGFKPLDSFEIHLETLRAVATATQEGLYRYRAVVLLQNYSDETNANQSGESWKGATQKEGNVAGPSRAEMLEAFQKARLLVRDAEIEKAIKGLFVLLDKMDGQSERQLHLGIISSNYKLVHQESLQGIITREEFLRGHAIASKALLLMTGDLEAQIGPQ